MMSHVFVELVDHIWQAMLNKSLKEKVGEGPSGSVYTTKPSKLKIEVELPSARERVDYYKNRIKQGKGIIPVFVRLSNPSRIVDGNTRALAYQELGLDVPVIKVNRLKTLMALVNKSPSEVYKELTESLLREVGRR